MQRISLTDKLASFAEQWSPKIVAELNGQHVKVVKLCGDFVWHHHQDEDELFMVLAGKLHLDLRDPEAGERTVTLGPGELCVVPRGVEHRPRASEEAHVMLVEPASTLNTGNVRDARTVDRPGWI